MNTNQPCVFECINRWQCITLIYKTNHQAMVSVSGVSSGAEADGFLGPQHLQQGPECRDSAMANVSRPVNEVVLFF